MAETAPSTSDDDVLAGASAAGVLLLTADKDFGHLVYRQGRAHAGVILLRLAGLPNSTKAEIVSRILESHAQELVGAFSVIGRSQLRIRRSLESVPDLDVE